MCQALEQAQSAGTVPSFGTGYFDPKLMLPEKTWQMPIFGGIFNIIEFIVSLGRVNKDLGVEFPTKRQVLGFFKNLLVPFLAVHSILSSVSKSAAGNVLLSGTYAFLHFTWIAMFACGTINYGFIAFGWAAFFLNACILTGIRMDIRGRLGIGGNTVGDFIVGSFLYPQALLQMELQLEDDVYDLDGEGITVRMSQRDDTVPLTTGHGKEHEHSA